MDAWGLGCFQQVASSIHKRGFGEGAQRIGGFTGTRTGGTDAHKTRSQCKA